MTQLKPTTPNEAVARARAMCGADGKAIVYRLKDKSGGRDPFAVDPASHWRTLLRRIRVASCDCAGFVAWCLGYDRFQPDRFPIYGGWINCDSMIMDARGPASFFAETSTPRAGDLLVYPSIDLDHDGSRDRVGHVGLVTDAGRWQPGVLATLRVAHCSSGNQRRLGRAIAESTALAWAGADRFRDQRNSRWVAIFLRFRHFTATQ